MNTNRVNELMASMKSFGKDTYQKGEQLNEMFALQQELVNLTFNDEHAAEAKLRVWDVVNHLEQLNNDCSGAANEELEAFKKSARVLSNLIKAEVSGKKGEEKAFRTLQYVQAKHTTLKNVELSRGDLRSELDAVVVTPGCITIVEVKNTQRPIFIDENGDYYKTGEFLRWDCNIAAKLRIKEDLLRQTLEDEGLRDIEIRSIVAFTDNKIEIQNKCDGINTCFVNQVAYKIDDYARETRFQSIDMKLAVEAIENAASKESYAPDFDVVQLKMDFATLMVKLEEASEAMNAAVDDEEPMAEEEVIYTEADDTAKRDNCRRTGWDVLKGVFSSRYAGYLGSAAAGAALSIVSTVAINSLRKGGF